MASGMCPAAHSRERMVTVAAVVLGEGVAIGELAGATDVDATARALVDMLDGMVIERLAGDGILELADVERRAMLLLLIDRSS